MKKGINCTVAVSLFLVLFAFGGCLPERIDGVQHSVETFDFGINDSNYAAMRSTTPHHVSEKIGSAITIDADVAMPDEMPSKCYNALPALTEKQLEDVRPFLSGGHALDGPFIAKCDFENWKMTGLNEVRYSDKDTAEILIGCDSVGFVAQGFVDRFDGVDYGMLNSKLLAPYDQGELQGFSSDEAKQLVVDMLTVFGLDDLASMQVYAMTAENMQAAKNQYVAQMVEAYQELDDYQEGAYAADMENLAQMAKVKYDSKDEMYSVHVQFASNGIPLNTTDYGNRFGVSGDVAAVGQSYLHAYVGTEGIRLIDSMNIFQLGSSYESGEGGIVPLDKALNVLAKRYGSVVDSDTAHVDKISLEYCALPDSKSETGVVLVPAWVFRNADDPDYGIRINALTAEVI
jgi:hypothetical protein